MALRLRQVATSGTVAFAVWLIGRTPVVVRLTQAEYDAFAVTRQGVGDAPGRPDPAARFLMAAGGIAALDTADGWPETGDCWEETDARGQTVLVVARSSAPEFAYTFLAADDPGTGTVSRARGVRVQSDGHRQVVASYDVRRLGDVERALPAATPRTVATDLDAEVPNHRSVTFDAASHGTAIATSLTVSHTVANQANRYLAGLSSQRLGQSLTGVTYNGDALTSRANAGGGAGDFTRAQLYDMVAPDVGTANIVFSYSGNTAAVGGAISAYGVDQTNPRTDTDAAHANDDTPTITLTSAAGELVITNVSWSKGASNESAGANTVDATWTEAWNDVTATGGAGQRGGAAAYIAGAASVTRTDAIEAGGSPDWAMVGVSLAAATLLLRVGRDGMVGAMGGMRGM